MEGQRKLARDERNKRNPSQALLDGNSKIINNEMKKQIHSQAKKQFKCRERSSWTFILYDNEVLYSASENKAGTQTAVTA